MSVVATGKICFTVWSQYRLLRAGQNSTSKNITEQNSAVQNRAEQNRTEQNRTKQNKTKQRYLEHVLVAAAISNPNTYHT